MAPKSSLSTAQSAGCLVLFSLPFAAVGVGIAIWLAISVLRSREMQSWVEVPAEITRAELQSHRSRKGGVTHEAVADYRYQFNGQPFTGSRVSLLSGSDNIGSFQHDAYIELKSHLDRHQPFRCFVNPSKPADSILYRNLRWEMLTFLTAFACVFGAAGFGLLTGAVVTNRKSAQMTSAAPADEPWKARADWASGRIPQRRSFAAWPVATMVAIFWTVASLPLLLVMPQLLHDVKTPWVWLMVVIPAVNLLLLIGVLYPLVRARKYGESIFQLAGNSGIVGGQLAGVVRIPHEIKTEAGFRQRLSCLQMFRSKDSPSENVCWQDERIVAHTLRGGLPDETVVPVLFAVPITSPETTISNAATPVEWRLEVSAPAAGINYKAIFEVPVFKTAESRADFQLDPQLIAKYSAQADSGAILHAARILEEPSADGGVRLVFPAARNWIVGMMSAFTAAAFGGIGWALHSSGAPLIFPIGFGFFAVLIGGVSADVWLYRSIVEASCHGLKFRGGWFGFGATRTWAVDEIERFTTPQYMSSGTKVWSNIELRLTDGKKQTIAKGLPGQAVVHTVLDLLNAKLGRDAKSDAT
jgi:Protein of unknown function (DUF3592)